MGDSIPTADAPEENQRGISDTRRGELESIAAKNPYIAAVIGFLGGPLGYAYLGQWRWFAISFLTLNYLLLGIVIVPVHVVTLHKSAERELRSAGYEV